MNYSALPQSLIRVANSVLPALSGSKVSFCEKHNIFLSQGYTSAAGNTYFQGARMSDRLIVMYDFGQGWAHLFLNGIRLFCFDGQEMKQIAQRFFYCCYWDENNARRLCVDMLKDFMSSQSRMMGAVVTPAQIANFSTSMVDEALAGIKGRRLLY